MKFASFVSLGMLSILLPVAAATARADEVWKDAAMTVLLANAETVLEAKQMVTSGRAVFGGITHRVVSETPGNGGANRYPILIEEFVFEVDANFGDAIARIGKLTITQTTTRYPRSPGIAYQAKVEPYPIGTILR